MCCINAKRSQSQPKVCAECPVPPLDLRRQGILALRVEEDGLRPLNVLDRLPLFPHERLVLFHGHLLIRQQDRLPLPPHRRGVQVDRVHVRYGRHHKHGLHQHVLRDGSQAARSGPPAEGNFGDLGEAALGHVQVDVVHGEEVPILLDEGVLGRRQNVDEILHVESLGRNDDGESSHELGDHPVVDQIPGYGAVEVFALHLVIVELLLHLGPESDGGGVHAAVDDALEARVGPAADEEDVGRVDLEEIAAGVLAAGFLFAASMH
mmetsp:Transcript_43411/g.132080  ORF Transcript_43411/g.132080 Transcript_43411/m.132080 type:complete len:264 (-) Transcript_43411:735-1526(-)